MIECNTQIFILFSALGGAFGCGHNKHSSKPPAPEANENLQKTELKTYDFYLSAADPAAGLQLSGFPKGLPLSIGSGLRTYSYNPQTGEAVLYGLTDRGPNGDAPSYKLASGALIGTKVFAAPDFQPSLFKLKYSPAHGLEILEKIGMKDQGQDISGRPIPPGTTGATGEQPLDQHLQPLSFDLHGLDPEGIDFDQDGHAWICDEYGPFIIKMDRRSGEILEKYGPTTGLPQVLAYRQANRGFEGIAVADNGKIYAVIQSTLDINGKTKGTADFLRIVEFDPLTHATRMFAYPIDSHSYAKNSDAKIGDLLSLGHGRFAVIEGGKDAAKNQQNKIFGIDITQASDLSGRTIDQSDAKGQELEFTSLASLAEQGIQPVRKVLIADLRRSGWIHEKAEGLTLLDARTLLVINDNDFGVSATIAGTQNNDPAAYQIDASGQLNLNALPSPGVYSLEPAPAELASTQLLILKLDDDIQRFFTKQ